MLTGLKNFAIDKILRHIAENPKLNKATNLLALIPVAIGAALAANANWLLIAQCCSKPGSLGETVRIAGCVFLASFLWLCGKCTWLKSWFPVAQAIVAEAQKEAAAGGAGGK